MSNMLGVAGNFHEFMHCGRYQRVIMIVQAPKLTRFLKHILKYSLIIHFEPLLKIFFFFGYLFLSNINSIRDKHFNQNAVDISSYHCAIFLNLWAFILFLRLLIIFLIFIFHKVFIIILSQYFYVFNN